MSDSLVAIIDIGSNSVRLVVYRMGGRAPAVAFNEKVMSALGRGVGQTGALEGGAMASALRALVRYATLCDQMKVATITAVATAAVREATNGAAFVAEVEQRCGLKIEIISGDREAEYAALGVLSAMPEADGVVGDLGGGSLELARVSGGTVGARVSLPIGPLMLRETHDLAQDRAVREALAAVAWLDDCQGKPFYMVGGAWRALVHVDMALKKWPLPVIHHYQLDTSTLPRLAAVVNGMDRKQAKAIPHLSERRVPVLPLALRILDAVLQRLASPCAIGSVYGVREGLLYRQLPEQVRLQDPLLAACQREADLGPRFPGHSEALRGWMDPLFAPDETPEHSRLRQAACILADIAWRGHPDYRAARALDTALHSNWVGIDATGRAMVGLALYHCYGGGPDVGSEGLSAVRALLLPLEMERAIRWGLALRLGQRLNGGAVGALASGRLRLTDDMLQLFLREDHAPLYGEVVDRRLKALANRFGVMHMVQFFPDPAG